MSEQQLPNQPTTTWRNPRWASLVGPLAALRPIFESLSEYLGRPTFANGIKLGTGVVAPNPNTGGVDPVTIPITGFNPPAPGGLTLSTGATDLATYIDVSWAAGTGAGQPAVEYEVSAYRTSDNRLDAVVFVTDTKARLAPVDPSTGYTVKVKALTAVGTPSSDLTGTITSSSGPQVPGSRIVAASVTATQIAANAITATKLASVAIEVGKYISSANYSAGSAGWYIDGAGNAEFNNVTVRGTVVSSTVSSSTITGSEITGTRFRTGTSGTYVEITHNYAQGISFYVSSLKMGEVVGTSSGLRIRSGQAVQITDLSGNPQDLTVGSLTADGKPVLGMSRGGFSGTTNGSGDLSVGHSLGTTPSSVVITLNTGSAFGGSKMNPVIVSMGSSSFTVRFYDSSTGSALTGASVSGYFIAC